MKTVRANTVGYVCEALRRSVNLAAPIRFHGDIARVSSLDDDPDGPCYIPIFEVLTFRGLRFNTCPETVLEDSPMVPISASLFLSRAPLVPNTAVTVGELLRELASTTYQADWSLHIKCIDMFEYETDLQLSESTADQALAAHDAYGGAQFGAELQFCGAEQMTDGTAVVDLIYPLNVLVR